MMTPYQQMCALLGEKKLYEPDGSLSVNSALATTEHVQAVVQQVVVNGIPPIDVGTF